jgi:hypothetical protein
MLHSGVEAMLPKPSSWSRGEEHVFYVIRAYRLGVLVLIRPFLWQHVRLSADSASSTIAAATYMIPGTLLPLLDLVRDRAHERGRVRKSLWEGALNAPNHFFPAYPACIFSLPL